MSSKKCVKQNMAAKTVVAALYRAEPALHQLDCESAGRQWKAVVLDPDRTALEDLRQRAGVLECEESALTLEEMYTALLARFHRPGAGQTGGNGLQATGDERTAPSGVMAPGPEGEQP